MYVSTSMRKLCIASALTATLAAFATDSITVLDKEDSGPVVGASAISAGGLIIGLTDSNGTIAADAKDYPLSFRSLGYEATTISAPADTVFLSPASYSLREVTVSSAGRPITRVLTYAREYCTGATPVDTLQLYNEYMLEYFFADGKVKGFHKSDNAATPLRIRRYGRISDSHGRDSVMRPRYDDDISALSFMQCMAFVPIEQKEETEAMRNGAATDTVHGKYSPQFVYRNSERLFTVDCDALSDKKDHKWSPWFFKLVGLTMDMEKADWSLAYRRNETGKYGIYDFICGTYNLHVLARGKLFKKLAGVKDAIGIDCYIEQYPVAVEHLTVDDYKEMRKDRLDRLEDFRIPDDVQPLPPAIEQLVDRIGRELPRQ